MRQRKYIKGRQNSGTDIFVESIVCWNLPKVIKNRLYRHDISDIYELAACTEHNLMEMGFYDLEIALICHTLQSYGMVLRKDSETED
ncbi:hypothetical protein DWX43_17145 [Clostridium sp. AF19-22AC]|jgi:hypothetical protein|uniref:hypothetical protein n=1 Tax=Clostridia TaxID=186801 RepID=UPI000E5140B3|nr:MULTISPECIES: hypothetical protein [Clostridia]RHR25850.1 hypothetical protein DWX43_17145 [Clostridium sp. AF19-22AC]